MYIYQSLKDFIIIMIIPIIVFVLLAIFLYISRNNYKDYFNGGIIGFYEDGLGEHGNYVGNNRAGSLTNIITPATIYDT